MTYSINLNTVSSEIFSALSDLDQKHVGTEHYMGIAYFWGQDTKHQLREASIAQRKRIHKKWLAESLDLLGATDRHFDIIQEVTA